MHFLERQLLCLLHPYRLEIFKTTVFIPLDNFKLQFTNILFRSQQIIDIIRYPAVVFLPWFHLFGWTIPSSYRVLYGVDSIHHKFPDFKMTSSNGLFCPTNMPKSKSSLKHTKQQIYKFENLKLANVRHFCLKNFNRFIIHQHFLTNQSTCLL